MMHYKEAASPRWKLNSTNFGSNIVHKIFRVGAGIQKSELMLMRAPQHQFNFVRRLSWSVSSIFQRKFTLSVRRSRK